MSRTIVMIHGMWGSGAYWDNYRRFFEARGYRCLTPTLRYHDVPPHMPPHPELGTTSVLQYADDLQAEIEALDEPPILMGHSMGGLIAQILGARGLAQGLVLLTPASPAGIVAIRYSVIKSFRSGLLRWGFWRKPYRQTFDEAQYAMLHLLPPAEQRARYLEFGFESGRAAFEIGFWPFDARRATRVRSRDVRVPALVVAGQEDRITPASVVRKVARKYGAEYVEFPHHAHWVVGEPGWEEIAEACAG